MSSPTSPETLPIPPNLYSKILTQFDTLHSKGLLFYTPTTPEYIADAHGFKFVFHTSPSFQKPILSPTNPARHHASGPFSFPDPLFVICPIGPTHLLQLNKFCMFRPSLILHPVVFPEQNEDLDEGDMKGLWAVFKELENGQENERWMPFYNCRANAGASQGHKHMQVVPREVDHGEGGGVGCLKHLLMLLEKTGGYLLVGSPLFAIPKRSLHRHPTNLPEIPVQHALILLPENANWKDVMGQYRKCLLQGIGECEGKMAYNMLFVREWMIVLPRSWKGREGVGTNSAGMMGMVWVKDGKEREVWSEEGMSLYLRSLGVHESMRA